MSDERLNICPYNPNNHLVTEDDLVGIFRKCGLDINPVSVKSYHEAFIHRSYVRKKVLSYSKRGQGKVTLAPRPPNCLELQPESNERLEFLGDSVIDCVVVSYLFRRFPEADEGFMTKLKTRLVKTTALANFARFLDLGPFIIISRHVEEKCEGRTSDRMLEDMFESFIGAMYLDFSEMSSEEATRNGFIYGPGYAACETFLMNMMEQQVDFEDLILNDENYKDMLLRYFQQTYSANPRYVEMTTDGPSHQKMFTMGVLDTRGNIIGKGVEKTKKKAEQMASRMTLLRFGVITE